MTDINIEDLRNAVNALGKDKLVEQYSPEQLAMLENLLLLMNKPNKKRLNF